MIKDVTYRSGNQVERFRTSADCRLVIRSIALLLDDFVAHF